MEDMTFYAIMGLTAGVLVFADFVVYILAIYRRNVLFHRITQRTVPNRATWFIWACVGVITALSYYQSGATDTVWFAAANALGFVIVAFLSLKYGEGGVNLTDLLCLLGAAIAAFLWWAYNSPEMALATALGIETFASIPTIKKSWLEPTKESRLAWILSLFASIANVFALNWETAGFWVVLFPMYILVLNSLITLPLFLLWKRKE